MAYNTITHAKGSSLEVEDYCYNSEWHDNTIFDSQYAGISWAPADASHSPTPCKFYNNQISINQSTYWSAASPTLNSYAIKGENRSINTGMVNWYVNHNTFYAQGNAMNGINTGWVQNTTWKNNIFFAEDAYAIYRSGLASQDTDYDFNLYWNSNSTNLLQRWNTWDATGYSTLALALASGDWDGTWDINSIEANPLFVDADSNLTLQILSPACDQGEGGSDIGAVPCEYDAPTYPTNITYNQDFNLVNDLVVNASGATDANGDPITYYYRFYNSDDSTLLQDYSTNDTYVLQSTDMFDRILVQAFASDGVLNGTSMAILVTPTTVDIYAYNNFTGSAIDNLYIYTDYRNYTGIDSGDSIYINYGVYNVTIAATFYSNATVEKNITNISVSTNITVYLNQYQNFHIYDEVTGLPFNTNETISTSVQYYCAESIETYDFNVTANENSAFLPVECAWGFIKLDIEYAGGSYYRALTPATSETSIDFYVLDLTTDTGVQVIFELNDLVGEFTNGYLILENPVNGTSVTIHKQQFDAEKKVVAYLLSNGYYTIKIQTSDTTTTRSLGYIIAESAGTKTITVPDIDFLPTSYLGTLIRWTWAASNSSRIQLEYRDDTDELT